MNETFAKQIDRLANRIVSGDAVFFIGSGYSIDSEKNDTKMLLARLMARFEALTGYLQKEFKALTAGATAKDLRLTFPKTFWLKTSRDGSIFAKRFIKANFNIAVPSYYTINDWMCSAFEKLIDAIDELPNKSGIVDAVNPLENELLHSYHDILKVANFRPLAPIEITRYIELATLTRKKPATWFENAAAGKALFLDTMGFADPHVMAGEPMGPDLDAVLTSYDSRLRPRHFALAWLALEGLLPVLITTNYDLLLEGAYQLAGMLPLNPPAARWTQSRSGVLAKAQALKLPLNRRMRYFTRIADATQFFSHGEAQQAAMITKIHGCVDSYREARKEAGAWRSILPTIVFTFREIQNWREDSWSRDLLKTLLRTRSVVFAGYSGMDTVIHDTFRSVYEEMAIHRARHPNEKAFPKLPTAAPAPAAPPAPATGGDATAFFMDVAEKREFHGLEILRAASRAAGLSDPDLTDHPNRVAFEFSKFPNLDEVLEWTFHASYRQLQLQALESELRRVVYQLLGRPSREIEADAVLSSFRHLLRFERKSAEHYERRPETERREHFQHMTAWTLRFHYALMREFALAENLLRYPADTFQIDRISAYPWYCPISEHPQWAAWAAVIELAIRRRAAAWRGEARRWVRSVHELEPVRHTCPLLLLGDKACGTRRALRIELAIMRGMSRRDALAPHLELLSPISWTLRSETVPWWVQSDKRRPVTTPGPAAIWEWAAFGSAAPAAAKPQTVHAFFGEDNGLAGSEHVA
jgi:SIR2-like domain